MVRAFLILGRGLLQERVYPLEERLTIGRSPINLVHLTDSSVSRRHAVLYGLGGKTIVEDLGSQNGTYVNGERVHKAVLRSGDTLRIGNVLFHYREEDAPEKEPLEITRELLQGTDELAQLRISFGEKPATGTSHRSKRLSEALSRIPLFAPLDAEGLAMVAQTARLLVLARGRSVFRQGDRGSSLYIVLDGKVRMVTYDQEGWEVQTAILGENQFFGEMSFLSGEPRNATVEVLEESLLCEVSFGTMRELVRKAPQLQDIMESYYREQIEKGELKKRALRLVDRRKRSRLNERVPVSFSVACTRSISGQFRGRVFHSMSQDISLTGVRIKVQDRTLLGLPAGCQLRLEIGLPRGWGVLRALGILRNIVEGKEGGDLGYLGIEFQEMPSRHRKKLENFIRGDAPAR